ncbi:MAG TPA: hypothetical protein VEL75_14465 [Candidatus Methylomirabilis sp.]|nr:hypothetical protein [Candidatus Methylomirabilis sp.]
MKVMKMVVPTAALAALAGTGATLAAAGIECLYVLDCGRNLGVDQTLASKQRIAAVLEENKAQLWINHDKAESAQLRYAPGYYE